MQLSILIATNRPDLLACSRIAQACSWAGPNVEVIVRDNSGDARKRALLPQFQRDNCNIIIAEPCDPLTNISEIIKLAQGEFIFILADDDFCFDHAITSLSRTIEQFGKDSSVAGITGAYIVETSQESMVVSYQDIDSDDVAARVAGYLSYPGANVMSYAPVRQDVFKRVFAFMGTMPAVFSFHDQIMCLLYLLNGKFVRLPRLLYLYDFGVWEKTETGQKRDVDLYKAAGLDPAINKLHWFLCAFEGAALALNSDLFPDHSLAQRQAVTNSWFGTMFGRFREHERLTFGSLLAKDAEKLCAKLRGMAGTNSFDSMLADISSVIALSSKSHAQSYFDFWDAILKKRNPVSCDADASRASA